MSLGPTIKMKKRLKRIVLVAVALAFVVISGNLVHVSVFQHDEYVNRANSQQLRPQKIEANRGAIYDRNMDVLAQSATVWDVIISPKDIKNGDEDGQKAELIIDGLSKLLEMETPEEKEKIRAMTKKTNSQYEKVKTHIEKETADEIRRFISQNKLYNEIILVENTKRYYPNSTLGASVIGFVGTDSQGLYGLELKYDEELSGTDGRVVSLKNATGENMPDSMEEKYDPINGNSLVLTIDETIQHFVEKTLNQVMVQHSPNEGCAAIVMDVNTGEILAMANLPTYDLNQPFTIYDERLIAQAEGKTEEERRAIRDKQWNNKAISYNYEPGSTFKLITASAALEEGTSSLQSSFSCGGMIQVADRHMKCHIYPRSHGTLDFTHAVVNSCNPAFVQIGANLGYHLFYDYFEGFGLTEKTGIDLPGEGVSLYKTEDALKSPVALASCSFGQSNSITAIQLITAVSAVTNGGNLVTPHVVKDVLDDNGNVVRSVGTQVKRQVISEETSEKMRVIMEAVVSQKPTTNASVAGYRIGGKSGTAQKLNKKESGLYVASYIAVAPIDNPQIAVLCMIDEPTSGQIYGSVVAMPPVASILADTLPYLGISPEYTAEELEEKEVTMPLLVNNGVLEAESKLAAVGLGKPEIIGTGEMVVKQVPSVGSTIPKDGRVILYTEHTEEEKVTVPDVTGLRPSQAKKKLSDLGLNVLIEGAFVNDEMSEITMQDVEPGTEVEYGSVISLMSVEKYTD